MKSYPCVKTGEGVSLSSQPGSHSITCQPVTPQPSTISHHANTLTPCRHINRRGHHCRLFSTFPDLELCPHHARQLQNRKQLQHDKNAAELLSGVEDFSTPEAVNALLGNLVRQLARKRIDRRDAMPIAYVCQLLLGSIASMDRHDAALNADRSSDIPRIVFDRPDPIPDTAKIAALFATAQPSTPQNPAQNNEGRA
jgi:hypothetical protein